jgi:hypothetical protein
MLFTEALQVLLKGRYVCRPDMKSLGEYLVLMPGMLNIWMIKTQPSANAGNWLPAINDLLADDWEKVDRVEKPLPVDPELLPAA